MSKTHLRTYLGQFIVNLNAFEFVGSMEDNRGRTRPALGKQSASLGIDLTLFIGPEDKPRNVGTQSYAFTTKKTPPAESHKGLPPMIDVLPEEVTKTWLEEIDKIIDLKLPFYTDESKESAAAGPAGYIRINRIEVLLPWGKPDQHRVSVMAGLYADEKYTQQIVTSSIVVTFCTPEYAERLYREAGQREPSAAELAAFMVDNDLFDLVGFLQVPTIQTGVGIMATNFYTTMKTQVPQYIDIDVSVVMKDFATTLGGMYPAKE